MKSHIITLTVQGTVNEDLRKNLFVFWKMGDDLMIGITSTNPYYKGVDNRLTRFDLLSDEQIDNLEKLDEFYKDVGRETLFDKIRCTTYHELQKKDPKPWASIEFDDNLYVADMIDIIIYKILTTPSNQSIVIDLDDEIIKGEKGEIDVSSKQNLFSYHKLEDIISCLF